MSTAIDQKVVEMRFDNKNFETNVATTMSTLDKFKQKLNLSGASKGLENINNASKKIDMSGLGSSVEKVQAKFSSLEVVGVTALANITNSVVNASKRMLASLTVEPIKTGFNEYELKMNSVQTIMASTGESLATVNGYLEELNKYADRTIYSFSDMTSNIGKFTNAGVKLEDAVLAIKGISNEAAVSGANADEASRAMYNFAQALSAGYVKLIDWKSIENANMATVEFKNNLIETAVELGTVVKVGEKYQSVTTDAKGKVSELFTATSMYNESLSAQWLTTDVLVNTLKDYSDETTEIGKKAYHAAQDIKTFSQMMDTLKESAQSGWAQTWEIVFGDFEEGKALWTKIGNAIGGVIEKLSDARNTMLKGALGSKWDELYGKINKVGISTEKFQEKLKTVAKKHGVEVDKLVKEYGSLEKAMSLGKVEGYSKIIKETIKSMLGLSDATDETTKSTEDYSEIVRRVIRGDFGNGQERVKALTEAGYNYAKVQNKVNEELGYAYRHTEVLTDEQLKNADSIVKLSDAQLKNKGYTEDQIEALRELEKASDEAGTSIDELINGISKPSGRDMLGEMFSKIGASLSKIFNAIKTAWSETFKTDFNASDVLYGIIESLYKLSDALVIGENTLNQITRISKGVFALIKLFSSFNTKVIVLAFNILKGVLGLTNLDLLEFAARIGDGIVKIKDLIFNSKILKIDLDKIADSIVGLISKFIEWINTFLKLPGVQKTITNIKNALSDLTDTVSDLIEGNISIGKFFSKILNKISSGFNKLVESCPGLKKVVSLVKELFKAFKGSSVVSGALDSITEWFDKIKDNFKDAHDVGKNIIDGIIEGLKDGTMTLGRAIIEIGKMMIEVLCEVLEIHSPSRKTFEAAKYYILGAVEGLKKFAKYLWSTLKNIANKLVDFVKNINLGPIIATGFGVGILLLAKKTLDVVDKFANAFDNLGGIFSSVKNFISDFDKGMKKYLNAKVWETRSEIIFNIAKSVAILAVSVALLANINESRLWEAVGAVGALVGMLIALAAVYAAMDHFNIGDTSKNSLSILSMAGSMLILASALKILSTISPEGLDIAIQGLTAIVIGLTFLLVAFGKLPSVADFANVTKVGEMLLMMAGAMLIMTRVIKIISGLDAKSIAKGLLVIGAIEYLFAGIIAVSEFSGKYASQAGKMLIEMAIAIGIMVGVIKLISYLESSEIKRGIGVIGAIESLFVAIIAVSSIAGKNASKAGAMLLMMSGAIFIIVLVIKMISELSEEQISNGLKVITKIELLFAAIIAVSKLAGNNAVKAGVMLITLSGAVLILVGALWVLSSIDQEGLNKALGIITVLELLFAGIIGVTYFAKDCMKNLIVITVAIALLVGALVGLSFIDPQKLSTASMSLSLVIGVFALLIYATKYLDKAGESFGKKLGTIIALTAVVAALGGIIVGLSNIENPNSAIISAGALSILILTLAGVMYILSHSKGMDKGNIGESILALGLLTIVLDLLTVSILILKNVDPSKSIGNAIALSALLIVMTGVMAVLALIGEASVNAYLGIAGLALITLVLLSLALILDYMSDMDPANSIENVKALSALLLVMTGVSAVLALIGFGAGTIIAGSVGLLALSGVLMVLGIILKKVDDMQIQNGFTSIVLLTALLKVITEVASVLALIGFGAVNIIAGSIGLLALSGVLMVLGIILKKMDEMQIQNGFNSVMMLTALLVVMSDVCVKLALVGPLALIGVAAMGALTLLMAKIGIFASAIGNFVKDSSNLDAGLEILKKLANGIGSIVGNLISGFMGGIADGLPGIGLKLSLFAISVIPFIALMKTVDSSVLKGVGILSGSILALVAADIIAGITSFMPLSSSFALLGLQLSAFAIAAIPFISITKNLDESVCDGVKSLAEAMLILTASDLISGITRFTGGVTSLSDFGAELVLFGPQLAAFAESVSGLDDHSLQAMKTSAEAGKLLAEMASSFPNSGGLIGKIFGENDADTFGKQLAGFGESLKSYGESVSGIDAYIKSIESSVDAGKSLSELADSIPNSGGFIAEFFTGDNTIDSFGEQLKGFGTGIMAYGESVSGIGQYVESMDSAAKAGKALAELAKNIPNSGGFIAEFFTGDNSIDTFGTSLVAFGKGINGYGKSVSGISSYVEGINKSKEVTNTLIEIANTIKSDLNFDSGDMEMNKLGNSLSSFATGVSKYATSMSQVGDLSASNGKVESLVETTNYVHSNLDWDNGEAEITKLGNNLSSFGGMASKYYTSMSGIGDLSGANSIIKSAVEIVNFVKNNLDWDNGEAEITKLGNNLSSFGNSISSYAKSMSSIGDLSSSVNAVKTLVKITNDIKSSFSSEKGSSLQSACKNIEYLSKTVSNFYKSVNDSKTYSISSLATSINKLIKSVKELSGLKFDGLDSLSAKLGSLSNTSFEKFVNSFAKSSKSAIAYTTKMVNDMISAIKKSNNSFSNEGSNVVKKFANGIAKSKKNAANAANNMSSESASKARSYTNYSKFYNAGSYMVDGFASGISANTFKAEAKATAMANAAEKAAKEALDINSPSKVFRKIGYSVPEGFAMGIDRLSGVVKSSAISMGEVALSSVSNSISKIAGLVESDIDSQPTIRPVIDLTDVRSGVSTIGNLLQFDPSVGVLANVGRINTSMNLRTQNEDVVSAINKLRKDIGSMDRTTYSINGVTYDDGSNISEAVKTIVRAAKIERRT